MENLRFGAQTCIGVDGPSGRRRANRNLSEPRRDGEREIGRLKAPDLRAGGIGRPLASYQPDDDKQNYRADDGSDDVTNNSPAE